MSGNKRERRIWEQDDESVPQSIDEWVAAEEAREYELRAKKLVTIPADEYFDDNKYILQSSGRRLESASQSPPNTPEPSSHIDVSLTEVDPKFVRTTTSSLIDQAADLIRLRQVIEGEKTEREKNQEEDKKILEAVSKKDKNLASAQELAQGIRYTESLKTSWRPIAKYRKMSEEEHSENRAKWLILRREKTFLLRLGAL
ncbi:hypothetical protein L0F63_002867, partial [Massospora cicadina]